MKRGGIIHPELAHGLASLGHGDVVCIADAGLPVHPNVRRIDLAFTLGQPSFLDVVAAVVGELVIEAMTVAEEMFERSPEIAEGIHRLVPGVVLASVPHEQFKERSGQARLVVRSGEATPYANVLIGSGVPFG